MPPLQTKNWWFRNFHCFITCSTCRFICYFNCQLLCYVLMYLLQFKKMFCSLSIDKNTVKFTTLCQWLKEEMKSHKSITHWLRLHYIMQHYVIKSFFLVLKIKMICCQLDDTILLYIEKNNRRDKITRCYRPEKEEILETSLNVYPTQILKLLSQFFPLKALVGKW